jgi:peptidoglycan-N-acetylglucosamine deacetylase
MHTKRVGPVPARFFTHSSPAIGSLKRRRDATVSATTMTSTNEPTDPTLATSHAAHKERIVCSHGEGMTHALSFDIEDWFHMVEIQAVADPDEWPNLPSLVERYTEWIIQAVSEAKVTATFFVLGWIAERYPHLVKLMTDHGHEIGTHSYWHRKVYELSPNVFREDMKRSIDVIESAGNRKVRGFRAPSFSITPGTEWAFDVLHEVGVEYDASLFPAPRGHGGYPCPREPHEFTRAPSGRSMPELPMSMMKLGLRRVPFSGGGYMRLLPGWLIRRGFDQLAAEKLPTVVYLHPRDFAPDCPRVPMPMFRRFKCYVGLHTTKAKLKMLLERYRFDTCANVLEHHLATSGRSSS